MTNTWLGTSKALSARLKESHESAGFFVDRRATLWSTGEAESSSFERRLTPFDLRMT
jgi:hypothetical protein